MLHFMLISNRQLYTKGLFYCCVEKIKRRCIRSEYRDDISYSAHGPCPHKKINLVELVGVAESYLGSRFTVEVQNFRVCPQQQSYELLSVFISGVCHTRCSYFFSAVCVTRCSYFCVAILKTKQLIRWLNRFIENVRLIFKDLVNQNT